MIHSSLEFVVKGFLRSNQCKTLLASEICDFYLASSEKGHATDVQLKNSENLTFLLKSTHFELKC